MMMMCLVVSLMDHHAITVISQKDTGNSFVSLYITNTTYIFRLFVFQIPLEENHFSRPTDLCIYVFLLTKQGNNTAGAVSLLEICIYHSRLESLKKNVTFL